MQLRKTGFISGGILGVLAVGALLPTTRADQTWLEAESSCTDDGWFQYRVGSRYWPIMSSLTLGSFNVLSTDWAEIGAGSAGWTATTTNQLVWNYSSPDPQVLPYDATFSARSSLTNHQLGTGVITMSLTLYESPAVSGGVYSVNIVGYWMFPALVPCLPGQADGSPASFYTNLTYQDIVITEVIREAGAVKGIAFENQYDDSTYLLEATHELNQANWQKITYLYAEKGLFTWTTNADLGAWGNYFRLEYIGHGFIDASNLPPLNTTPSLTVAKNSNRTLRKKALVPQMSLVTKDKFDVAFDSVPGHNYAVEVRSSGQAVWSAHCSASGTRTTMSLPTTGLPPAGIIQISEIP